MLDQHKFALFLIFCSLVSFLKAIQISERNAHIPVFAWSGESYLIKQNAQLTKEITSDDFALFLEWCITGNTQHEGYIVQNLEVTQRTYNPEIVILFLLSKLSTAEIPNLGTQLRNSIEREKSSLSVPYMVTSDSGSVDRAVALVTEVTLAKGGTFVYAGAGGPLLQQLKQRSEIVSLNIREIIEYLRRKSQLFTNGVTDVVVIHFVDKTSDGEQQSTLNFLDEIIEKTMAIIKERTSHYIALLTAQHATLPTHITWEWQPTLFENYLILDTNCTVNCTNNTTNQTIGFLDLFPSSVVQSILMCALFITITLFAVCCVDSIQTHDKLLRPDQTLRLKEFN